MDILTKMIEIYNNKAEKEQAEIAKQMILHIDEIPKCSIYEVADICFTSTASISRFVKKTECPSFQQFKSAIWSILNYYPNTNRKIPRGQAGTMESTIGQYTQYYTDHIFRFSRQLSPEILEKTVDQIHAAGKIFFMSPDILDFVSLQYDLSLQGKETYYAANLSDSFTGTADSVDESSYVLFFLPEERESHRTKILLREIMETGALMGIVADRNFDLPAGENITAIRYEHTGSDMDFTIMRYFLQLLIVRNRTKYLDQMVIGANRDTAK